MASGMITKYNTNIVMHADAKDIWGDAWCNG